MSRPENPAAPTPGYGPVDRRLLGIPGPVWTMALWFGAACIVMTIAMFFPMTPVSNDEGRGAGRIAVIAYAFCIFVALLVMRARTPSWFLYTQTAVSVVASLAYVALAVVAAGAVTASISLIVIAAYTGWWMPRLVALAFTACGSAGLLIVLVVDDRIPELLATWLVISGISIGLALAFGTLVAHMKLQLVTDPLTGLLNRSGMVALVDQRADSARTAAPRALVVIDLDHFKVINDRSGHLAGDRALSDFGAALRGIIRPEDVAFRSGGDEFVLILPKTDKAGAEALVSRLRSSTALAWSYGRTEWAAGESFDTALARADRLMYEQKAQRAAESD